MKTGRRSVPRRARNWLSPEAIEAKKQRCRLERRWKASNAESDRLSYSKSPSLSVKLRGSLSPFDFDQPRSKELLSDLTPVTLAEVSKLLQSMSNKSSQLDYIPTSLVKSCADTFSILIPHLANHSFSQATFPSKFKLALISPLLKKSDPPKSELLNFRPISNLNTIDKMLALARLFPHISISPSFCPLPSACRKFHPTETALLKLTNDIMETIDSGKIIILTALDMSAAFDTLDHTTFLHRLQHTFGLFGYVISWVCSYLTNHTSFVKIDSSSSPNMTIFTGVLQGSVFGPFFFVLFILPVASVAHNRMIPLIKNSIFKKNFHKQNVIKGFILMTVFIFTSISFLFLPVFFVHYFAICHW